jgi:hypothetical protein
VKRADLLPDTSAVVGCYSVHVYCCHPSDRQAGRRCGSMDEFIGETRAECLAAAGAAGWWIGRGRDRVLCPFHVRRMPR